MLFKTGDENGTEEKCYSFWSWTSLPYINHSKKLLKCFSKNPIRLTPLPQCIHAVSCAPHQKSTRAIEFSFEVAWNVVSADIQLTKIKMWVNKRYKSFVGSFWSHHTNIVYHLTQRTAWFVPVLCGLINSSDELVNGKDEVCYPNPHIIRNF